MSQVIKLQEKELQEVKDTQNTITQLIYGLGQLEVQKTNLFSEFERVQKNQNKLAKDLQDKYGEGNINLETGEITLTESPKSTE